MEKRETSKNPARVKDRFTWNLPRVSRTLFTVLSVAMCSFQLYTAAYMPLEAMKQRSLHLIFALALIFLLYSAWGKKEKILASFLDWICIIGAVASGSYIFYFYSIEVVFRAGMPTTLDLVMGAIMLLLVLEATKRTIGPIMPAIAILFLLYAAYGNYLPVLGHRGYDWDRIISQAYLSLDGIFGAVLSVSATFVFIFIFFGALMQATEAGQLFIDIAYSLFGSVRGGPAKVAVMASCAFGTISGSAVGNVVSTGTFTIPLMKKVGYRPGYAGAVEALASTGGQIMPPIMGAAAFIMAEVLEISYVQVAKAAIIPALLYFLAAFVAVDNRAIRDNLKGIPRSQLESPLKVLRRSWTIFVPIAVLIYLLFIIQWSLMKVGFWSIVATVLVTQFKKGTRLNLQKTLKMCEAAARGILEVASVCACAGIISCVLMMTGLGLRLSGVLATLCGGNLLILLVFCMIASIIFGMGLPTTAVYLITAVLLAPAISDFGVKPIAAHLFVFYFGILSAITPPVCLAAYAGAAIAGSDPMKTGYTAWRLGLSAFIVPFFFIYNPFLLLEGDWFGIIINAITAAIGVASITLASEGFLFRPVPLFLRAIMLAGGILLISSSTISNLSGIFLVGVTLLWQYVQTVRERREGIIAVGKLN